MNTAFVSVPSLTPWLDIGRVLIGTFVGAALAFAANIYFQYLQHLRANRAAGNVALSILSKQYGDFVIFRAGLGAELSEKEGWPLWLQISPTIFRFSEHLRFDIPTLAFLFENKQLDLLPELVLAESKYQDLRVLLENNSKACEIRDRALATAGLGNFTLGDLRRAEIAIDFALRSQLQANNEFLRYRAKTDAAIYRKAGENLYAFMLRFGKPDEIKKFTAMGAREGIENQEWTMD